MLRVASFLVAALFATGCAGRRPPDIDPSVRAHAEALVRAGCYRCLQEALALYEGQAARRPAAAGRQRVRVLALLAARVRELGLFGQPDWLAQGRALASTLPAASIERIFLDLVGMVREPTAAEGPDAWEPHQRQRARIDELRARVQTELEPLSATDVVTAYFLRLFACVDNPLDTPPPLRVHRDVPLVAYRAALCGRERDAALAAVLAREPRFTEAHYFRAELIFSTGALLSTESELNRLEAPFREMPAAAYLRGQVAMVMEDFARAVTQFDIVLAQVPNQPRALLQRLEALSYAGRSDAAQRAATTLIELGTWFQGEAHYWRAWNRRQLKQLDEAALDIEAAKRLLFNAAVPKLAGLIALDRDQLDKALAELTTSIERKGDDCDVHFALGQVHARRALWADAARSFESAAGCSVDAQADAAQRLAEIAASPGEEGYQQRLIARAKRDRELARAREGISALNAANSFVRAAKPALARTWAQRAMAWEEWAGRARDLLARLP